MRCPFLFPFFPSSFAAFLASLNFSHYHSLASRLPRPLAAFFLFSHTQHISLPTSSPSSSARRSQRRRQDLESGLASDDDDDFSDTSSHHSNEDELPVPSPVLGGLSSLGGGRKKSYAIAPSSKHRVETAVEQVQRGVGNVLETLGWRGGEGVGEWGGAGRGGAGGAGEGIARAFWGVRRQDWTGGIRLGEGGFSSSGGGGGGAGGRRNDNPPPVPPKPHARSQSTSSAASTSSVALFDLGDDVEADAAELPTDFSLSSASASSLLS